MLDDTERKLLHVIWNLYRLNAAKVNIGRLSRLSGRSREQITAALTKLRDERYLAWDEATGSVQVVELQEGKLMRGVGS